MNSAGSLEKFFDRAIARVQAAVEQEVRRTVDLARKDYILVAKAKVESAFSKIIDDFYNDYTPLFYDRTESLRELLNITISPSGFTLEGEFLPEKLLDAPARSAVGVEKRGFYTQEDGLYDQVFRKGWHGGADKINATKASRYGAHPNPGTPYWRTPEGVYRSWGRRAAIAETSPLEAFNNWIEEYKQKGRDNDLRECWNRRAAEMRVKF